MWSIGLWEPMDRKFGLRPLSWRVGHRYTKYLGLDGHGLDHASIFALMNGVYNMCVMCVMCCMLGE